MQSLQNNTTIKNLKDKFDNFLQGNWFLPSCAVLVVFFHSLDLTTVGFGFFMLLAAYCFCTQKDLLPVVTIAALIFYVISTGFVGDNDNFEGVFGKYIVFVIVFSVCALIILASIIYRVVKKSTNKFVKSTLFWPTIAFCGCLLISGLFSQYYLSALNFGLIASLVVTYLGVLLLAFNSSSRLTLDYMAKLVLTIGIVACVQLLLYFLFNLDIVDYIIQNKFTRLGWSWHNGIAILIVACIPAAFYFAYKNTSYTRLAFVALGFAMYFVQLLTVSRSGLGAGGLVLAFLTLALFFKSQKKERLQLIGVGVVVLIFVVILALIFKKQVQQILQNFVNIGLDDSARFDWWRLALRVFGKHPLFGVGFEYDKSTYINSQPFFAIHSTPLQYLATMGIVGAGVGIWFFAKRYSLLAKNHRFERIFMLTTVFVFVIVGLIELVMNAPFFVIIINLIFAAIELENKNSKEFQNEQL